MPIRSVLVTGGAGYIGSHLVDRLVARDYEVTVLDNLEPQVHRSGTWPSYANPRARYVRGDVRDRAVFEPLVLAADAVVHFGAAVSVGQSMYQVDRYVDVNTRGTALLLDILVNAKHHVEKVIVASSIGVYGEGAYRCAACGPVAPGIRPAAAARGARLGAALPAVRRARRLDPDARGQGALPRQHLFDDEVPPGRDGAAHRQDVRHSGRGAALLQRLRAAPEPEQSVRGRGRDLVEPAAQRQAAGRLRGRRAAARLRLDPRRRRLPGADAGDTGRRLPAGERRLGRDGHDSRDRAAAGAAARDVDRAAGHADRPHVRHPPQHRRHHARARGARLRAGGQPRAGLWRADRVGAARRPMRRWTSSTARSRSSRTRGCSSGHDRRVRAVEGLPRARGDGGRGVRSAAPRARRVLPRGGRAARRAAAVQRRLRPLRQRPSIRRCFRRTSARRSSTRSATSATRTSIASTPRRSCASCGPGTTSRAGLGRPPAAGSRRSAASAASSGLPGHRPIVSRLLKQS